MSKYDAGEIRALFERGENIIGWIRSREGTANNSETAILYSYDAQAGSYVAELQDETRRQFKDDFGRTTRSRTRRACAGEACLTLG